MLHVKPRTEKKVAQFLVAYGYFSHLPLYLKITRVQRRKVRRYLPLFPGYVFTRLLPDERVRMLQTNLIVKTIPVPHPRRMIHQLRQIAHASREWPEMKTTTTYKAGDYVRVIGGPFYGTEGYVKRKGRDATLCLNVDILNVAVEIAVSPADIEKIDP